MTLNKHISRSEIVIVMRNTLLRAGDREFVALLRAMKRVRIPRRQIYLSMLELYGQLDWVQNDKEVHRLSNWLDEVVGHTHDDHPLWKGELRFPKGSKYPR